MVDPMAFGCADLSFSWGDHICTIYEDYDQQMTVMLPFMSQGLQAGQRCVWISSPASAQRFREALAGIGSDRLTLEASGQLVIVDEIGFYVHDGLFRPDRTLALGRALLLDGQRQGYLKWTAFKDQQVWLSTAEAQHIVAGQKTESQ